MKPGYASGRTPQRWLGWAVTVALHAAALLALLSTAPAREALGLAAPIMVSLLAPPEPKPEVKPTELPKPLPMRQRESLKPMPIIAAPADAPSPHSAPAQPEPPKAAQPITASMPAAAQTAAPLIPPRFDAAYLDNPAPPYPVLARRMGEQGKVVLRVLVSASGAAERLELRASSGSARLDNAALETVQRWRFVPARQGTEAIAAWVLVPISFSLQG